jgi:hypothetical protein
MSVGLVIDIIGDATKFVQATDKAEQSAGGLGGILGSTAAKATLVGGAVVAAGAALWGMAEGAAADRAEQEKLTAAIDAAGAATATSTAEVEAAIAAGQERAFSDSETREGLQSLVTATGDVTAATALLQSAQDIARLSGVDLATASDAVAKAHAGSDGALRKLIPGLEKGASATDTIRNASKLAAGQADKYAASTEGQTARMGDAFGELGETIGSALLPIIDAILPALLPVIKQFGKLIERVLPVLTPLFDVLGEILGELIPIVLEVVDALMPLVEILIELMRRVLPVILEAFRKVLPVVRFVASAIKTLVGAIRSLVDWLGRAISKVGRFLEKINPLSNISLPSLPFLSAAPAIGGLAATRGAAPVAYAGGAAGGIHITVNGAIDPEATARQIRRILAGHGARTGAAVAV